MPSTGVDVRGAVASAVKSAAAFNIVMPCGRGGVGPVRQ